MRMCEKCNLAMYSIDHILYVASWPSAMETYMVDLFSIVGDLFLHFSYCWLVVKVRISLSYKSIREKALVRSRSHKDQPLSHRRTVSQCASKVPEIRIQSLVHFFILHLNWENTSLTMHILVQLAKVFAFRNNTMGLLKISWNHPNLLCVGKTWYH